MKINKELHNEYMQEVLAGICESFDISELPNSAEEWQLAKQQISEKLLMPGSVLTAIDSIRAMIMVAGEVNV
jgi:hypothetical protein